MPDGIWGHCNPNPDGSYSIFINAKLCYEMQQKVYLHELYHINNNDFEKLDVDSIEFKAHKEGYK
jgi:hypothetical protein